VHRLVTIDLSEADFAAFDQYEEIVLSRLPAFGARLDMRFRSADRRSEMHVLFFPAESAYQAFLADPIRADARQLWDESRAKAISIEIEELN
jgi:hypothetical protein